MLRILRRAHGHDSEFTVYANDADVLSRRYPDIRWRLPPAATSRSWRNPYLRGALHRTAAARFRIAARHRQGALAPVASRLLGPDERSCLESFATADVVISSGGTYLVEHYPLARALFSCELALMLGRPLVLFTQSLGPFTRPRNRRRLRTILEHAALVLLRDDASRAHCEELGIRTDRVHVSADAAFALREPPRQPNPPRAPGLRELRVAISVREWSHFRATPCSDGMTRYRDAMRAAVSHLVERHGAVVTFLSTCQGTPEYWADDSRLAAQIVEDLPHHVRQRVCVDREFHTPADLVERISSFDLVVATRMHMAILGLVACVPVCAIAYEFKTRELFERLRLAAWLQDIETITGASAASMLDDIIGQLPQIRGMLEDRVERESARAWDAARLMRAAVGAPPERP